MTFFLRVNHQSVKVNTSEITYIEGLKDNARVHFVNSDKKMLSLITLKALEEKLQAGKFMRIHKSFIVSLANITSITKNAVHIGEVIIPVSAPFNPEFEAFAGKWR
jgi:two-component system response regulator LytT